MPLYTFLNNLLNVLVQIANKMGLQMKNFRVDAVVDKSQAAHVTLRGGDNIYIRTRISVTSHKLQEQVSTQLPHLSPDADIKCTINIKVVATGPMLYSQTSTVPVIIRLSVRGRTRTISAHLSAKVDKICPLLFKTVILPRAPLYSLCERNVFLQDHNKTDATNHATPPIIGDTACTMQ
jgi:hypothetical protein